MHNPAASVCRRQLSSRRDVCGLPCQNGATRASWRFATLPLCQIIHSGGNAMTQAVAFDPIGYQGFLTYGPLGLAGLLLVLVVTAFSLRKVDEAGERVLKLVLFVGAFCFVAALVAQHLATPPGDYSKQRAALRSAAS